MSKNMTLKCYEVGGHDLKQIFSKELDIPEGEVLHHFGASCSEEYMSFVLSSQPTVLRLLNVEGGKWETYDCGSNIQTVLWDLNDPRVLVCQCHDFSSDDENANSILKSIFVSSTYGITAKDTVAFPSDADKLLSVSVPYQIFSKKEEVLAGSNERFLVQVLKEYQGLQDEPLNVIKMITDFCYNLSLGFVEEAMKGIKLIKNEAVWESMARMCLKTGKIKLAKLCLGKLKNARGLRTVSYYSSHLEEEEQLILIALQFGLIEEAKDMAVSSNSYSFLNKVLQSAGKWDKALEIAASKDRLSLPSTFFQFGDHLSTIGDKIGAVAAYEKSNASRSHVLRMFLDDREELNNFVERASDNSVKKWAGQNAESHGDYDKAIKYYESIKDIPSLVRAYSRSGKMKKAFELVESNPDNLAGAYMIASELEAQEMFADAVTYFARAKCFSNAIRLAKDHKIDKELMQLALQADEKIMYEAAQYYEDIKETDKAIMLYSKSGSISKAIDLAAASKSAALLETIANQLNPDQHSDALERIANYLSDFGSSDSVLKMLIIGKKFDEVLSICESQDVRITEHLLDQFDLSDQDQQVQVKSIRGRLGEICLKQGSYFLASKQFAQVYIFNVGRRPT